VQLSFCEMSVWKRTAMRCSCSMPIRVRCDARLMAKPITADDFEVPHETAPALPMRAWGDNVVIGVRRQPPCHRRQSRGGNRHWPFRRQSLSSASSSSSL